MLPVIGIVGRPNVGKSTLFNRLTRSQDALVDDVPGVTRDRIYGLAIAQDHHFLIVDTGGLGEDDGTFPALISEQVDAVLDESNAIIFLVDATEGLTRVDEKIAQYLGKKDCPVSIVVNKCEGLEPELAMLEFQALGFSEPVAISARRGNGVSQMIEPIVRSLPISDDPLWLDPGPKVAVVGKPNVGKSTLINALCRDDRLIVSDVPGTTRDTVTVPLQHGDAQFRLIDTAGIRRRSKVQESLEKLSVVKALQVIEAAHVVILVIDGNDQISDQDASLAGLVRRAGRPVVLAINKSDKLKESERREAERALQRKLAFAAHHQALFVSGLRRQGLNKLLKAVGKAWRSAMIEMPTAVLTRMLHDAVTQTAPPLAKRRPVKLKYAHQGGRNPPVVVVHGNNVNSVPDHYRRYLEKYFRDQFELFGTEVQVVFRAGKNPFDKSR